MHLPSVRYVSRGLDAVLYVFSPVVALYLLRIWQRRQILARLGRRTLIICDIPYVHQACPPALNARALRNRTHTILQVSFMAVCCSALA